MRLSQLFPVALLLLTFGCTKQEKIGGKTPERVYPAAVSLSPATTELLAQKTKIKVIGRTESCNYPPTISGAPVVMNGVKPNFEIIAQIMPPLVVYDGALIGKDDLAQFKTLGIETFGFEAVTIEGFRDELFKLGSMSGSETTVSLYVDEMETALNTGKALLAGKTPKVAILLAGQSTEHLIAGTDSFQADIVKRLGGVPVGPKGKAFLPVNMETLIADNPDVIITAGNADSIFGDARLKSTNAIKNRMVRGLAPDVLLRKGSRVERLIKMIGDALAGAS